VVANHLHREVVEGLLAAGKHVLCEKPFAPSIEDAEAMVAAARGTGLQTGVGFTFRRSPAINAIRDQLNGGTIGQALHFNGHYWCDYACDPRGPMSWRYKGGPGSGALADIGSHAIDCGEFESVRSSRSGARCWRRTSPSGPCRWVPPSGMPPPS
jgi:predicted dehydrogenase